MASTKTQTSSSNAFEFCSRLSLTLLTGLKARDLAQLAEHLRNVPGSVIYHHTHHFLEMHQHLSPEPPNDFAYWVSNILLEERLGEQLAAIDMLQFGSLRELRDTLVSVIQKVLETSSDLRVAPPGEEFYFMRSASFVLPTGVRALNLREFRDGLANISLSSISYHMFDARLRLEQGDNDFAQWIETAIGDRSLAQALRNVDPYTHTEEGLRRRMIGLVERHL